MSPEDEWFRMFGVTWYREDLWKQQALRIQELESQLKEWKEIAEALAQDVTKLEGQLQWIRDITEEARPEFPREEYFDE